jgi:hypothetical protein
VVLLLAARVRLVRLEKLTAAQGRLVGERVGSGRRYLLLLQALLVL